MKDKKDWRMSISLTEEMANAIYKMRMDERYTRMSYTEIIRVLIQEGLNHLEAETRPA